MRDVSVITPVYNTPIQWLDELAENILSQTYSNFEWILVDDGSTHAETINWLSEISHKYNWIKLAGHTHNKGLPAARNTGIRQASGEFYFFVDADDKLSHTIIEKCRLILIANAEYSFVNTYVKGFGSQQYKWKGGFHEGALNLRENRNTSNFMARNNVFVKLSFDEEMTSGGEDWDFWFQAADNGYWGYTIPEYLFHYRRHSNSAWTAIHNKQQLAVLRDQLQKKYSRLTKSDTFPQPQHSPFSLSHELEILKAGASPATTTPHLLCIFPWLEIGGADQFNLSLLSGLKKKGWDITIVTTKKADNVLEEEFDAVTNGIFHLPSLGPEYQYSTYLQYLIDTRSPSCIFLSNSQYGYFALPFIRAKYPKLPIVDYLHCEDLNWNNGGYPYFSQCFSSFIDKTFVASENLKNTVVKKGRSQENVVIAYINVDAQEIIPNKENRVTIRKKYGIGEDEVVIIYVARLTAQKQPDVLVRVLHNLKNLHRKFKCIIIGDGPEGSALERAICSKGLKKDIVWKGAMDNKTVLKYLDAADIFFLPSLYEGIALSIYEAMAKALPIVGADTGGQRELVAKDCGFLISSDSKEQEIQLYTERLDHLVQDLPLVKQMGEMARNRVCCHFQLSSMIETMQREIIETNPGPISENVLAAGYQRLLNYHLTIQDKYESAHSALMSTAVQMAIKHEKKMVWMKKVYNKIKSVFGK